MNAEERFEKWWATRHAKSVAFKPLFRSAWLACEAARDAEIERVIGTLDALQRQAVACGRIWQIDDAMHLLRSLLPAQPKEGET